MGIISIIAFLVGLLAYLNRKPEWVLTIFVFLVTSGYRFLPPTAFIVKGEDLLYILILIITIREGYINKQYLKFDGVAITKVISFYIVFQIFIVAITWITQAENINFIIKVARFNILYFSYFYLRTIPLENYKKFINILLVINLIQAFFFYLQTVGVTGILQGAVDEATSADKRVRYRNSPTSTTFFLLWGIINSKKNIGKLFYGIVFGGGLLLNMTRGAIYSIGSLFVIYAILKNKSKNYFAIISLVTIGYFIFAPVLEYRDKNSGSTMEDIQTILKADDLTKLAYNEEDGHLTFRVAMLAERYQYLKNNVKELLIGVGDIHEDSPNCYHRFHFLIGTTSNDQNSYYGYGQINSGDIAWVPILMRYGLVGLFTCSLILVLWVIYGLKYFKKTNDGIAMTFTLIGIQSVLLYFQGEYFDQVKMTLMLLIYISYIILHNKQFEIDNNIKKQIS